MSPGGFPAKAAPEEGAGLAKVSFRTDPEEGLGSLGEPVRMWLQVGRFGRLAKTTQGFQAPAST